MIPLSWLNLHVTTTVLKLFEKHEVVPQQHYLEKAENDNSPIPFANKHTLNSREIITQIIPFQNTTILVVDSQMHLYIHTYIYIYVYMK